jgi:hypothetical protein
MPIPENRADLNAFGYSYLGESRCSECGAPIQWWETPWKNKMPFDTQEDGKLIPHWSSCPKPDRFRKPT